MKNMEGPKPWPKPFQGYYYANDHEIWISFISLSPNQQGQGLFTQLLNQLKAEYGTIVVPSPMPRMRSILEAKGFQHEWMDHGDEWGAFQAYTYRNQHQTTNPKHD